LLQNKAKKIFGDTKKKPNRWKTNIPPHVDQGVDATQQPVFPKENEKGPSVDQPLGRGGKKVKLALRSSKNRLSSKRNIIERGVKVERGEGKG